jgi:hypothetical protein
VISCWHWENHQIMPQQAAVTKRQHQVGQGDNRNVSGLRSFLLPLLLVMMPQQADVTATRLGTWSQLS